MSLETRRTLSLQVEGHTTSTALEATIIQVFESNWSCTMVVEVNGLKLNGQFVIKLYDRRFTPKVRQHGETAS